MDELKILQKTYDMMQYLHQTLQQYPKAEKYGLKRIVSDAIAELQN